MKWNLSIYLEDDDATDDNDDYFDDNDVDNNDNYSDDNDTDYDKDYIYDNDDIFKSKIDDIFSNEGKWWH